MQKTICKTTKTPRQTQPTYCDLHAFIKEGGTDAQTMATTFLLKLRSYLDQSKGNTVLVSDHEHAERLWGLSYWVDQQTTEPTIGQLWQLPSLVVPNAKPILVVDKSTLIDSSSCRTLYKMYKNVNVENEKKIIDLMKSFKIQSLKKSFLFDKNNWNLKLTKATMLDLNREFATEAQRRYRFICSRCVTSMQSPYSKLPVITLEIQILAIALLDLLLTPR